MSSRGKAPWEFSAPAAGSKSAVPNVPTPEGAALGVELARIASVELERARRQFPHADHQRLCDDCAFRRGTVPNQCPSTLMDAVKCIIEDEPFFCHKGTEGGSAEPKRVCAGWFAMSAAQERIACTVSEVGSRNGLMSKRCDHGSEFEWAPVAGGWRIDRREGCRCWWPEPANPETT